MDIYVILKDAITLAQKGDNSELKKKLYDIQSELIELQKRNLYLEKKIKQICDLVELKANVIYTANEI